VAASDSEIRVIQPLTPAPSPTRHRTALPAVATDFAAQVFCTDDSKYDNSPDPSLPPMIDVKRFVKKCPRLIELGKCAFAPLFDLCYINSSLQNGTDAMLVVHGS